MKVICPHCKHETNHEVVAKFGVGQNQMEDFQWGRAYEIIRCSGCDTISFRIESWSEDDFDPHTGKANVSEELFPLRTTGREPILHSYEHLPTKINRIYGEVLQALNNGMPILAGVGLRALIEAMCNNHNAKGTGLQEKINAMASMGVLSKMQSDMLHTHRFLGNIAAHEIEAAHPRELIAAIDIAETMIKTLYILPHLNDSIRTGKTSAAPAQKLQPPSASAI
ncbi:MAG: DUF4145 domain-containing protein [Methylacidiphilales bacterium]|nr:DUF4145 domain-containing protein [Candidatus Methylacidiphilales bacterium]